MIEQGGNQCALITTSYAPCRMEVAGETPDLGRCELAGSGRAIEFATFDTRAPQRQLFANGAASDYPD